MADNDLRHVLENLLSDIPMEVAPEKAAPKSAIVSGASPDSLARLERHAIYLQAVSKVSHAASSILDLDELLPQVVDLIRGQFGFYYVGIFLMEDDWAVLQAGTGDAGRQMLEQGHRLRVGDDSMIGWCIAHQRARIALDVGEDAVRFNNPALPKTRSEMALPLISQGQPIGAMTIQSVEEAAFSEEDISTLQTMADQLVTAIENARLFQGRERRLRELSVVNEIGRVIATAFELEELWEVVHQQMSSLFDTTNFYIATYEEGDDRWASAFHLEDGERQPSGRYSIESGLTGYIIRNRQSLLFRSREEIAAFHKERGMEFIGELSRSWLGVPLITADKLVGVMAIQDYGQAGLYGQEDLSLFSTVAGQVAGALDNVRLLEETRRRAREMEAINEVGRTITSLLDLDTLLQQIVDITKTRFGHYFVSIALVEGDQIRFRAGSTIGDSDKRLDGERVTIDLPRGPGLVAEAARTGQPVLVDDVLDDPRYLLVPQLPDTRSELDMPIKVKGRVIGVLDVQSDRPSAYNQASVAGLQSLVSQAGVAIENARLFQDRESRIGELAVLNEIRRAVSEQLDLERLLETVYDRVRRIIAVDTFYVALYDEQTETISYPLLYDEGRRYQEPRAPLSPEGHVRQVIDSGEPLLIGRTPDEIEATVLTSKTALGNKEAPSASLLYVPLRIGQRIVGVMSVQSYSPDAYDERGVALLTAIASQAAIAIHNARLFAETQRMVEQTQLLLHASEATASTLESSEAMRRIARTVAQALDADTAAAYLVDEKSEELWPIAGYHVPPEHLEMYQRSRIPIESSPFVEKALKDRQTTFTNDARNDPLYDEELGRFIPAQSILLTPMIVKDEVIGGVWAVWWEEAHRLTEEERQLAEGIVRQAAIAIESARLFEETQRRADQLGVLHEMSLELAQEQRDLDTALETVTRRAMDLLDSDGGGVWLWREEDQNLELALTFQVGDIDFTGRQLKPGEGLTGKAFAEGKIQVVDHYPTWNGQSAVFGDAPFISGLAVPMIWQTEVVGALVVTRSEEGRPYSVTEQNLAHLLASQAAAVIQNARLFEETQARAEELAVLNELGRALSTRLDVDAALYNLYRHISQLMDLSNFYVAFYRPEANEISFPLVIEEGQQVQWEPHRSGKGLIEHVIETAEPLLIAENVRNYILEELEGVDHVGRGTQSWLGVPLLVGDQVLGILAVQSYDTPHLYTERHRDLLTAAASQAAIAIQNARLLERTQARARRERILREITTRVRGSTDPDTIMRTAVRELGTALDRPAFVRLGSAKPLSGASTIPGDGSEAEGGE